MRSAVQVGAVVVAAVEEDLTDGPCGVMIVEGMRGIVVGIDGDDATVRWAVGRRKVDLQYAVEDLGSVHRIVAGAR